MSDAATEDGGAAKQGELAERVRKISQDGYLIIPRLLPPEKVEALCVELEPWFQRTPACVGDFHGWRTTRINGVLAKAPISQELAMRPEILPIAQALLELACDCIQINLTQAIRVHPGERAQAPHRDEEMWPANTQGANWMVNVMWALDDFTEANGATRLWPGSHGAGLRRDVDPRASIAAEMPTGSALVFLGSITHGAGANRSPHPRTGLVISYCAGWLKTYENQYLTYPRYVARQFPKPLQRLIGYRMHRPNLGSWEGQDPILYLGDAGEISGHRDALTPEIEAQLRTHYETK